ncbi:MAG: hypothetical protein ACWGO1_12430, partial [Anaerolineales bacterium]
MLLSFAASVSLTRLFLVLTGYPKLGGEGLHIAHMLWGGLLLFAAALLPIIFANRWVYLLGSLLAGVGIGLFIDEVGKFITHNNDYFFPAAAPLIYAFFLICVLVYLQVNRPPAREPRAELYAALEMMEDVLDHDLDASERAEVVSQLQFVVAQKDQPELAKLAQALLEYVSQENIYIAPSSPGYTSKASAKLLQLEERYFTQFRFRSLLALGIAGLGIVSLIIPIQTISSYFQPVALASGLAGSSPIGSISLTDWFFQLQILQGLVGVLLVISTVLLLTNRERQGIRLSYFALLIYLTVVNLLLFYYNQFSTILAATVQFVLLLGVLYYRQRYVVTPMRDGELIGD